MNEESQETSYAESANSNMDSLVLEDILIDKESKGGKSPKKDIITHEFGLKSEELYKYVIVGFWNKFNKSVEPPLIPINPSAFTNKFSWFIS